MYIKAEVRHVSEDTINSVKAVQKKTKKVQKNPKIFSRQYTKQILVKLTEAEYIMLKKFANKNKASISDIVRSGIAYMIENEE